MFFDMVYLGFTLGRFGGINTQVRAISCFDSTITNTTGSRGSRQNSVHAGLPPKNHSPLHASTTSKNVYLRRPHRFHASDPLPIFLAISPNMHHHKVPTNLFRNLNQQHRHQPFRHLCRRRPGRGAVPQPGRHALRVGARVGCL